MRKINLASLLDDDLDFDFRADSFYIETLEQFDEQILQPYRIKKTVFYRGERKVALSRPLLPSMYRKKSILFDENEKVNLITVDELYKFYRQNTKYFQLYEDIIGKINTDSMYSFLAFSQHYFGISPLIDLTKSPYVALSFALKDRKIYDHDILIYMVEPKKSEDYTTSSKTADKWIRDYSVLVFNERNVTRFELENPFEAFNNFKLIYDKNKGNNFIEINSPTAKLIDVPTNDLMRYQQGVFLLLDDFTLAGKSYLTKKIRDEFAIKKYIINSAICPQLCEMLLTDYPYYAYENLTDLSKVVDMIKKSGY